MRSRLSARTEHILADLLAEALRPSTLKGGARTPTDDPAGNSAATGATSTGPTSTGPTSTGPTSTGIALIAVGSYGRGDPAPGSDLDLVLLHDPGAGRGVAEVAGIADRLWYPLWDSGVGLDHAVRSGSRARTLAREDLKVALGLLDARHIAGDRALSAALRSEVREDWRRQVRNRLPELLATARNRADQYGQLAFLLEPDLKEAAGGIRDVHALYALAAAWLTDPPNTAVRAGHQLLLDVRGELHRVSARGSDRLLMQEQAAVAEALGMADADALLTEVSAAGRAIAHCCDHTWRRVSPALGAEARTRRQPRPGARQPRPGARRPLADGVVEQGGEVVLARDADPRADPTLVLRGAAAAAEAGLRLSEHTVARLSAHFSGLGDPWPPAARAALVTLLGAGAGAVPVLESLDQAGLLAAMLPEWTSVRCRPQRNPVHRFTVDRHLVETAAQAAGLTRRVTRPDLLLLGALLHDLGKGHAGDHSLVGADLVAKIGPRLGLPPEDVTILVRMTRHHLLLIDTATRRDLADPATTALVADAVGDGETLDLLHALTEADARATGEGLWTPWKAALVAELVQRSSQLLAGRAPAPAAGPTLAARVLAQPGQLAVAVQLGPAPGPLPPGTLIPVTIAAPNGPGVLSAAAGVLAVNRLSVRSATAHTLGTMAVITFTVAPSFAGAPPVERLTSDLRRALEGSLDLGARLREREAAYPLGPAPVARPEVHLVENAATGATVVDVRAHDSAGLLYRVSAALVACGLDVRTALVSTFGAEAVDAFYVTSAGCPITDPAQRAAVVEAVLAASGPAKLGESG